MMSLYPVVGLLGVAIVLEQAEMKAPKSLSIRSKLLSQRLVLHALSFCTCTYRFWSFRWSVLKSWLFERILTCLSISLLHRP